MSKLKEIREALGLSASEVRNRLEHARPGWEYPFDLSENPSWADWLLFAELRLFAEALGVEITITLNHPPDENNETETWTVTVKR